MSVNCVARVTLIGSLSGATYTYSSNFSLTTVDTSYVKVITLYQSNLNSMIGTSYAKTFPATLVFYNLDGTSSSYSAYGNANYSLTNPSSITCRCVYIGYDESLSRYVYSCSYPVTQTSGSWQSWNWQPGLTSPSLSRTGYHNPRWRRNSDGRIYTAGGTVYAENSTNYYTQVWDANTYTINYNANDGANPPASVTATYDTSVSAAGQGSMSRIGYSFSGWKLNNEGDMISPGASLVNLTSENGGSVTLYAQWDVNTYYVKFNKSPADAVISGTMLDLGINYNETKPLTQNAFTRSGYSFSGWSVSQNTTISYLDEANFTMSYTDNQNLYTVWSANSYAITFDKQGGTGGSDTVSTVYAGDMPAASAPIKTGYAFNGYYDSVSGGTQYYSSSMGSVKKWDKPNNATLYARWTPITYTISFANNDGEGTMSTLSATYDTSITLPSNTFTKHGFKFDGWKVNNEGTKYADRASVMNLTTINNGQVVLYAQWVPDACFTFINGSYHIIKTVYVYVGGTTPGWRRATALYKCDGQSGGTYAWRQARYFVDNQ